MRGRGDRKDLMRLFNTLTGIEELFEPHDGKIVKMYVCGVTPYSSTHVGHALSYVVFDTLRRYLEFLGYDVKHVQNFTDVDDKIIEVAKSEKKSIHDITSKYHKIYNQDMEMLGVKLPDIQPKATDHINEMIFFIFTKLLISLF